MRTYALAVTLAFVVPAVVESQPVRVGPEFRVNGYTTSHQYLASVAADAAGNFVVAWTDSVRDGSLEGIVARRFDSAGTPLGAEFQVNTYTLEYQFRPAVAAAATGSFVVVWTSFYQDGSGYGIFGQRYDAAGAAAGPEFRVNSTTLGDQVFARVASDPSGNFVVVWTSGYTFSGRDLVGQRYDASGVPLGGEFTINTYTTGYQGNGHVAVDAAGNFVVVWTSALQDGDLDGIFGQRFDASGAGLGPEFRINTETVDFQLLVRLSMAADGTFVVAWSSSADQDGSGAGVFARRYDASGAVQGPEFQVNAYTTGWQSDPHITSQPGGGFVVSWYSDNQDGSNFGVFGRRYDASGVPQGTEFRANAYTTARQIVQDVVGQPDGAFVVVWTSRGQDGDGYGVFGQRFDDGPDLIFSDGFESGTTSAWSAVSDDGGDLSVSADAALNTTTAGLQAVVDDGAGVYVEDYFPRRRGSLPRPLLLRPERVRPRGGRRPVPDAHLHCIRRGTGTPARRDRPEAEERRVQPRRTRAPRRRPAGRHPAPPRERGPALRGARLAPLERR